MINVALKWLKKWFVALLVKWLDDFEIILLFSFINMFLDYFTEDLRTYNYLFDYFFFLISF